MYVRNYSAEDDLTSLLNLDGNFSSSVPVVPCQAGWKYQQTDPEATTVVADVSSRFTLFQVFSFFEYLIVVSVWLLFDTLMTS